MLWATNHRQTKHLLRQPVLEEGPEVAAPLAASPSPFSRFPGSWGLEAFRGLHPEFAPVLPNLGGARPQVPDTPPGVSVRRLLRPDEGSKAESRVSSGHPPSQACGGRSLSQGGARPLLPASILGPPPPRRVGPRRSRPFPGLRHAPVPARVSAATAPAGSVEASSVSPSSGEARTPCAPGRLPREGARPPPRLHPLCLAAAFWGPCQSRPPRGPRGACAGGGSLTGRPPAGADALRCPAGVAAASRAGVEASRSGHGAPRQLGDSSGAGTGAPEATVGPARVARFILLTSRAGTGCGASTRLVVSRLSPTPSAPSELAEGNSARPL